MGDDKKSRKMEPAAAVSAVAGTGKSVLDLAKAILEAANAVRKAKWAKEDLKGDLDGIRDRMELVQSRVKEHALPSTPQGIKALEQLQLTLKAVSDELDALSVSAAAASATAVSTTKGEGILPH